MSFCMGGSGMTSPRSRLEPRCWYSPTDGYFVLMTLGNAGGRPVIVRHNTGKVVIDLPADAYELGGAEEDQSCNCAALDGTDEGFDLPFDPTRTEGAHEWFIAAVRDQEVAEHPIVWPDRPDIYWCAGSEGGCDTSHRSDFPRSMHMRRGGGARRER